MPQVTSSGTVAAMSAPPHTTEPVRALPGSHVECNVAGVSFHADTISTLAVGDPVVVAHDDRNPADRNAVVVRTSSGHVIGYLPGKFGLNTRFLATCPGPVAGEVTDIGEPSPQVPHRYVRIIIHLARPVDVDAGHIERVTAVVPAPDDASLPERSHTEADDAVGVAVNVYSRTGRYLGTLVEQTDTRTTVVNGTVTATYPNAVLAECATAGGV